MNEYKIEIEDDMYQNIKDDDYVKLLELGYKIAEMNSEMQQLASSIDVDAHTFAVTVHFIMLGNVAYAKYERVKIA